MMSPFAKKCMRILLVLFMTFTVLIATHKGEFWPFSIYPMFSQAGKPWTRALVQDVSQTPDSLIWNTTSLENLHGPVVALRQTGVKQIDFSNFVSKTDHWSPVRKRALRRMFQDAVPADARWMITKVQGRLTEGDSVAVKAVPFLLVGGDSVYTNPLLPEKAYSYR